MIISLTIRTTIWSVHRKIATKHLIRYQMHFAFVYFVNNRYDKRIPLIKWLIVISKRIVSSRSLSVSMFLSLSLSLPSQNHLNPDLYINDIQLSITNILYFVALFIAATHVWQLYASGVWEEEKQRCQWILQSYHSIVQDNTKLEFVVLIFWKAQVIEDIGKCIVLNLLFFKLSKNWYFGTLAIIS